jgi:macrophage erythroblast attacher
VYRSGSPSRPELTIRQSTADSIVSQQQLQDSQSAQKTLVTSSKARISHVQQLENITSFDSRAYSNWSHVRLQRHLVDYLLRRGYTDSAEVLARDEHLNGLSDVDIELFKDLQRIEDALRSGSATDALQWCKDNASTLKKGKVRFHTRVMVLYELSLTSFPQ